MKTETLAAEALQRFGAQLWQKRPSGEAGAGLILLEDRNSVAAWMSISEIRLCASNSAKEPWVQKFYSQLLRLVEGSSLAEDEMWTVILVNSEAYPGLGEWAMTARIRRPAKQSRRHRRATLRLKKGTS